MRILALLILSLIPLMAAHATNEDTLSNTRILTVTNSKAWKPFSYISETGEPSGILVDFWNAYSRNNNVQIEFLLLDWNDSINAVKDGRADVHGGLLFSSPRDEFLDFGNDIIVIDTQLYISQRLIGTDVNFFLTGVGNRGVGVVTGGYEQYFAQNNFPQLPLVEFSNNEELMQAAAQETIDGFISDLQVANFYMSVFEASAAYVPILHLYSGALKPAVSENNVSLLTTIDQGFNRVPRIEKEQILNRWFHVETVYPKHFITSVIFIVFLMASGYIYMLKRTVKERTRELEALNAKLLVQSQEDALTGISNRRHFVEQWKNFELGTPDVVIVLFDIDDFKSINDTYGHGVGDEVIHSVAATVKPLIPANALFARVGGEEFSIIASDMELDNAEFLTSKICQSVAEITIKSEPQASVSVSVGAVHYSQLLNPIAMTEADKLMYKAKSKGKNRVELVTHINN